MRRKIGSMFLAVSMLLALTPGTVMAARQERKPAMVREAADQMEIDADADKNGDTGTGRNADTEKNAGTDIDANVFLEGSGGETDPYRIGNAEQMRAFANIVNSAGGAEGAGVCAVLTQDIDLSDVCGAGIGSWSPIGTKAHPYTGTFDGGSFAIRGLYYNASGSSYAGLFGCNSGVIKNLGVADGVVAADSYTGGVCGFNNGTITGCYNAASVKGGRYTGGACGYNDGSGSVNVCYNTGAVSGSKYVGGICGYNANMMANCYNIGTVNGSSTSVGGICGYNKKQVSSCYNTGTVSGKGTDYVGSICGYNHSESIFLNCYYLITGTERGNYGVAKTQEQFAAGEVCWLLNDGNSEGVVWYQTCGEGFPAFGGKTVYQVQSYKGSGDTKEIVVSYTNEKNKRGAAPYTAAAAGENTGGHFEAASEGDSETASEGHVYREPEWKWKEYKEAAAVFTCQECGEEITLEASVKEKTTEATCAAEGKTVYTASVVKDGKTYRDTKTVKIAKTAHQALEAVKGTAATCEKAGFKMDCWTCPACGKYFKDQAGTVELSKNEVEAPALGHQYGIYYEWKWADDYSSAVIAFKCNNGCGETITVDGHIQFETTATCTKSGEMIYTAIAIYNGKEYKDNKTVNVPALPHDYSVEPEWQWASGYSSATATFRCSYGCGDSKKVTEASTSSKIKGTDCSTPGKIIYTVTVQFEGKSYSSTEDEEIPAAHTLVSVPAKKETCKAEGNTAHYKCSVCGKCFSDASGTMTVTEAATVIPKIAHVFEHVEGDIYKCTVCGGKYVVTETENGTRSFYSLEEASDGTPAESAVKEEHKEAGVLPADEQDGQSGQERQTEPTEPAGETEERKPAEQTGQTGETEEDKQAEQTGQTGETEEDKQAEQAGQTGEAEGGKQAEQSGQTEETEEGKQAEQTGLTEETEEEKQAEQTGETEEDKQAGQTRQTGETEEGKQAGQTGETEEGKQAEPTGQTEPTEQDEQERTDSVITNTWEVGAVSLRADSPVSDEAQEERAGWPFWASVVALAVFTGAILAFILHRKETG